MIIIKILISLILGLIFFFLSAIITDIINVEILKTKSNFNSISPVIGLMIGIIIGWSYLFPIIKDKYLTKFKNQILNKFDNFDTMKSRINFSITCFLIIYYFGFCFLLILEHADPFVVVTDKGAALFFWFPIFLFLTFKFIEWIIKGKK